MSCQDYQEQLTLYLLGDLEAGPAAQVCAHLETCAACRAAAGELERSLDLMRSAFVVSPAVPAQLDAAHRRRVLRAKFRWGPLPWQDLAKIAAVLLLSAGLLSALLLPAVKSARQKAMIIGRLGEVRGFRVATVRPSATEPDSSPSAVNHWGAGAEVDQRTTAQDSGVSRPGLDLKPTKETYLRPPEVSSKKPTWSMEVSRDAEKREGASGEQAALGDAVVSGGGILLANAERRHKSGRADAPDKQPDERVDPADRNQTTGKEAAGIAKGGSAVFLKNGSGTLTLNGVNTYSGSTTVSAGLQAGAGTVGKLVDGSGRDPTSGGQTGGDQFADNFNVAQSAMSAGGTMVPLRTTLPKPTMVGTPTQIRVQNLAAAEPHYAYAARAGGRETDSPPSPDRLKHDEKDKEKPPQSGDIPVTGRLFAEAPPPPTPQPETTPAVDDSRRARELYVAGEKSRGGGSGGGGSGGEAGGQDLARATLNWEGALDKRAPTARPQSHRSVSAKFAQTKEEADANGLVRTLDYAGWADRGGQQPGQQGGTDPKGEALWALRTAPPKTTELNKQLKEVSAESGIASLSDVTDSRTDTHRRFLPARAGEAKKLEDLQRSVDELRTLPAAAALPAPLTRPDGYVTGGDVTSFAAQGKAGHEALDYKEQDGRSNVGRAGLSDGEPAVAAGFFYGPGGAPAERLARKDMLAGKKSGKDLVVTDKLGGEFLGLRDSDKGTKTGSDTKPTGGGKSFGGGGPGDDAGGIDFAGAATGPLVLKGIGHGSYSGRLGGGNEIVRSKDDLVKLEGKDLVNGATFTDGNEKQQILRRQVADAQISLNLMRQALGDDNPDIQRLKAGIADLQQQLKTGLNDTRRGLEDSYHVAKVKHDRLEETELASVKTTDMEKSKAQPEETKPTKPVFRAAGVNPWVAAQAQTFSTFSISVDSASFTLARRYLNGGQRPPPESVRTEEFVNYFDYALPPPGRDLFSVQAQAARTPFCPPGVQLLKLGVKGRLVGRENRGANLTFLLDTSGSMNAPDRLDLARAALKLLAAKLGPADRVALVSFSSRARLVLDFTSATEQKKILAALDGIQAAGFTHLEAGLKLAYQTAARGFVSGAANRVILMSDGVANVGADATAELLAQVEQHRKQNIFCSVFGLGTGTYDDTMLQALASQGHGTYLFMDSLDEARRVFVDELAATLNKIAADVKIQVEFNPRRVKQYRQLGYEQRQLKTEDFRNDAVAAGEVGSGQSVTALYQVELQGDANEPLGTVRIRGRNLETGRVEELERAITAADLAPSFERADVRFRLAAAAAEFAEILRGSPYAEGARCADVAQVLRPVALELSLDQKVQELLRLVTAAHSAPPAAE